MLGNPLTSVGRRRTQFSAGAEPGDSNDMLPLQKMAGNDRNARGDSGTLKERALAEARCPYSVPCNVQHYVAVGRFPARTTGGAGGLRVAMALAAEDDRYVRGLTRVQPMRS